MKFQPHPRGAGLTAGVIGIGLALAACGGGRTLAAVKTSPTPRAVSPLNAAGFAADTLPSVAASPLAPTLAASPPAPAKVASPVPAASPSRRPVVAATVPKPPAGVPSPSTASGRSFSVTPNSGTSNTPITLKGTGCFGAGNGVSLTFVNPAGVDYTGEGWSSQPDGSWVENTWFSGGPNPPPGLYGLRLVCEGTADPTASKFTYGTLTFRVPG